MVHSQIIKCGGKTLLNRNQTIRLFERVLENEEAQAFVSAYNYTPPKSDKAADKIAVWYTPGSPWMLVVWIVANCIDGTEKIPLPVMNFTVARRTARSAERNVMAKTVKEIMRPVRIKHRTSIGSGRPNNKSKRASWKKYRGQGR
jgi:hypothetical protein